MNGKFLFTAALAALTVSCSQEELETPRAEVENRIAIETPVVAFGNGTQTRLTTEGSQAAVKWQENDGFGAMLVDQVTNLNKNVWTEWDQRYTITNDYKQSNFLFRYNSTTGTFNTDAAIVEGNLTFVDNSQIRLGVISLDRTLGGKIDYAIGEIKVAGNHTVQNGDNITVESGTVTVPAGIAYTITNDGGTLNVAGAPNAASTIDNNTGVVNINGDTNSNLTINNNGNALADPQQTSVINIAAGKTVKSVINNTANGKINNAGYLYGSIATGSYVITNDGEIVVTDINAGIDIKGNGGNICNNVQCPYVTVTGTRTVYCDLTSVPASIAVNINTVNLSGSITFAENVFAARKVFANVKTVNVADNTVITSNDMDGAGLGVTFNFGDQCIWKAAHPMVPVTLTNFSKNVTPGLQNVTWP